MFGFYGLGLRTYDTKDEGQDVSFKMQVSGFQVSGFQV